MAGRLGREDTKVSDDTPYAAERIREIWSKLSKDKRRFLDVLLHAVARKTLGDTLAEEYVPVRDRDGPVDLPAQLPHVHIIVEAVRLMPEALATGNAGRPELAVVPYLGEALGSIVEHDASAIQGYSGEYGELTGGTGGPQIESVGAYAEAYNSWIEKTALYLRDCRQTVRALSFNELTHLWDSPAAIDYLATHYLLRSKRHCDSRRVFIYDGSYFQTPALLQRLQAEVKVQLEAGVSVRVCSMEQLREIGKGYNYPLVSFGTYDRTAFGVLIPHNTHPTVRLIHESRQIRDAVGILDDVFDRAEAGQIWATKHDRDMDDSTRAFTSERMALLKKTIANTSLE